MEQININSGKSQDDVIDDLRKHSRVKARPIIPFIGAGTSMILGLPNWEQIVQEYASRVGFTGDIQSMFIGHNRSWPKVTDDIFTHSNNNLELYLEFMTSIHPTNASYQSLHVKLLKNFRRIITTNYDFAFENAFKDVFENHNLNLLYFPDSLNPMNFQEGTIAYMHGHISSKTFVFRHREYQYAYHESTEIVDFLTATIKTSYLLFIGFSFDDEVFRGALEGIISKWKKELQNRMDVYGQTKQEHPRLYVVLSYKDLEIVIDKIEMAKHNIPIDLLTKYFSLTIDGDFEIIESSEIEKELFFQDKFKMEYSRIKFNIERLKYLITLNFEILEYDNKNRTQIEEIISLLCKPDTQASEELPDFSNTKS